MKIVIGIVALALGFVIGRLQEPGLYENIFTAYTTGCIENIENKEQKYDFCVKKALEYEKNTKRIFNK